MKECQGNLFEGKKGLLHVERRKMGYISEIRKKVGHDAIFMPAAGGSIIKNNKILLQKRTDNGKWALNGGGLELGETFREALNREIKEELGIKMVKPKLVNIYSGNDMHVIYPNGDEVFAILAIYIAEEYEGEIKLDYNEVAEIAWFELDKLPDNINESDIKTINDLIKYYKREKEE